MVDDGGVPPLPRRVPGASGSPRPPAQVELGVISEDLRQRVLTAIAIELEHDEAERSRNAQEQNGAGDRGSHGVLGTRQAFRVDDAAGGDGGGPANGGVAGPAITGTAPGNADGARQANGTDASPVNAPPWDRDALWARTPAPHGDTARDKKADQANGAVADTAAAREPEDAAGRGDGTDAGDGTGGPDEAPHRRAVPLPRRAPGTNGAPPPPSELRRDYLPPSLLGRRLDPEAHTEPLPRISATRPGPADGPGGPAATGSGQSAPSVFTPIRPAAAPPAASTPAGSPAEPGSPASGPDTAQAPGAPPEPAPPDAPSAEDVPPGTVPPRSKPSASTLAAASAPTMPVGSTALAAAAAPTMPVGSAALAAAAGFAPPAGPAQTAPDDLEPPPRPATAPAASAAPAAPGQVTPPPPSPVSRPPAASPPAPPGYGWAADRGGTRPGDGRGAGTAVPLPAARPAGKRPRRSGRPYRIAGVILAVVALIAAAVIALLLSGKPTPAQGLGQGSHARSAAAVRRAAAWVAGQVSRTALVACDPAMCQALRSHGMPAGRLYQLGPQATSPLRSQIIVATAAVRAQFGNVLSSVYAPAVLASFGFGPGRIDIRQTAPHGAAAYRAMLGADLASRRASGAQLLHSGRIAAAAIARRELAAGEVDGRLLIAIAQMAATHPMFIVDFGVPAPGADQGIPLRQADLAEDAHAHHRAGHAVSAGYVRSMVSFLHGQHGQFRPARVQTVYLADGAAVLRIQFTAPSPLGLLGPHA